MATSVLDSVSRESTSCPGFNADTYDRYVLGLLDGTERANVDRELEQQCPACIAGVQRSINLWLVFAGSLQQVEPAADFRARLIRIADLSNRVLTVPKRYKRIREPAILISSLVVICLILGTLLIFTFLAGKESSRLDYFQRAKADSVGHQSETAQAQVTPPAPTVNSRQLAESLAHTGPSVSEKQLLDELAKAKAQLQQDEAILLSYKDSVHRDEQRTTNNSMLVSALENPGVRLLTFKSKDDVTAYAFVIENSKIVFVVSKLPPPPDQRQYQLWLVQKADHRFVSLKVFSITADVPAVITYEDKGSLSDLAGLLVTEEPMNGSTEPSPTRVLETPGVEGIATPVPTAAPPAAPAPLAR